MVSIMPDTTDMLDREGGRCIIQIAYGKRQGQRLPHRAVRLQGLGHYGADHPDGESHGGHSRAPHHASDGIRVLRAPGGRAQRRHVLLRHHGRGLVHGRRRRRWRLCQEGRRQLSQAERLQRRAAGHGRLLQQSADGMEPADRHLRVGFPGGHQRGRAVRRRPRRHGPQAGLLGRRRHRAASAPDDEHVLWRSRPLGHVGVFDPQRQGQAFHERGHGPAVRRRRLASASGRHRLRDRRQLHEDRAGCRA